MSQQIISSEEQMKLLDAADAAEEAGDFELAEKLLLQVPLSPNLAIGLLETDGLEAVIEQGFNLSEVEALHGSEWLEQFRRQAS